MSNLGRVKAALEIGSSLAVMVAALFLIWTLWLGSPTSPEMRTGRPQIEDVQDLHIDADYKGNVTGTGSVILVEFTDYQCPYCSAYARDVFPAVRRNLIDTGKTKYLVVNFPLEHIHPLARQAGEAAECAGRQSKYWEMHERLFTQPSALTLGDLAEHGQIVGLDDELFRSCMEGELDYKVQDDIMLGQSLGVIATPTFFAGRMQEDGSIAIAKRFNGAASIDNFRVIVEELSRSSE